MNQRIKDELERHKSIYNLCKIYGLERFEEEFYKKINILGEGAFGTVWKCMEIRYRDLVAVKFFDIKEIADQEKMISNIASLFVEKHILEKINGENSPFLPKFFGAYYLSDPEQPESIDKLVLVTEAGDHNLNDLVTICKKISCKDGMMSPYLPEEIYTFLNQMTEAFVLLRNLNIYHSDIKLQNIVYSKSRKGYMLIDFGVSKLIPVKHNNLKENDLCEINIEEYATAGTKAYMSPEKAKLFENKNDSKSFNPFKCDMWSLGICLEQMILSGNKKQETRVKDLTEIIIAKLKAEDWRLRCDVYGLKEVMGHFKGKIMSIDIKEPQAIEGMYIEQLDFKTMDKEGYENIYGRLNETQQTKDMLEVARKELEKVEQEYGPLNRANKQHFDGALYRLGEE